MQQGLGQDFEPIFESIVGWQACEIVKYYIVYVKGPVFIVCKRHIACIPEIQAYAEAPTVSCKSVAWCAFDPAVDAHDFWSQIVRSTVFDRFERAPDELGHAEINDLHRALLVNHDIGAFQIKMAYMMTM